MKRAALLLPMIAVLVASACEKQETRRVAWHDRQQFSAVIASKLRQLDDKIGRLPDIAADSVYAAGVEDLKRGEQSLRERFVAMATASDEAWPVVKDSMEFHYHRVREQYESIANIALLRTAVETAPVDSSIVSEKAQMD